MTPLDIVRFARHWWWIVLLCPLIGGAVAYAASDAMTPIYRAQTLLVIQEQPTSNTSTYNDILASERRARTYSRLAKTRPVLEETINRLGLALTPGDLASKVIASPIQDTQLITVAVDDPSPSRAVDIANTLSAVFVEQAVSQSASSVELRVAEQASVPGAPVSPRVKLNTALGGFLGLFVAGGLVLLLGYLDNTVKDSESLQRLVGRPALGEIPALRQREGLETVVAPQSSASEAFRGLRTNLQFAMIGKDVHSFLVTSSRPGDGKSTVITNLAVVMAQGGQRVIVVDGDLRRPRVHRFFRGLNNREGLTTLLMRPSFEGIEQFLQQTPVSGLRVLTTGPLPPNPADVLTSQRMSELVARLETEADVVLFDAPPQTVSDPLILASLVDGLVLVTSSRKTRANDLQASIAGAERSGVPLLGIIINRSTARSGSYYYYYYPSEAPPDGRAPASASGAGRRRRFPGLPRRKRSVSTGETSGGG